MESKEILGLLIGLVVVAGALTIGAISVYVSLSADMKARLALIEANSKERLALIEKGMDPALLNKPVKNHGDAALMWGLLLCGIGLGAIIGYVISYLTGLKGAVMINALAILLGGLGLLIYYKKQAGRLQHAKSNA